MHKRASLIPIFFQYRGKCCSEERALAGSHVVATEMGMLRRLPSS